MAPSVGIAGSCECSQAWSGDACITSELPLYNCTAEVSPDATAFKFANLGANALSVVVCDTALSECTPCDRHVPANSTVQLWAAKSTTRINATLCTAGATAPPRCMPALQRVYTASGGVWTPPLVTPFDGDRVFCQHATDCSGNVGVVFVVVNERCCS